MTDAVNDHADTLGASSQRYAAPPHETEDPARQIGEVFRRLSGCQSAYGDAGMSRIVASVLVALGRAAMAVSEMQARHLRERSTPPSPGIRVSSTARRVDFDGWNPGERD